MRTKGKNFLSKVRASRSGTRVATAAEVNERMDHIFEHIDQRSDGLKEMETALGRLVTESRWPKGYFGLSYAAAQEVARSEIETGLFHSDDAIPDAMILAAETLVAKQKNPSRAR